MTMRRTELRDDLRAVIAAGRELSPEDDAVLADMFLDQLDRRKETPRNPRTLSARNLRRCAGAAVLALVLLTGGALVSVHGTSHGGDSSVMPQSGMNVGRVVKVVPVLPSGKYPVAPAIPIPKHAPMQPKG